MSMPSAAKKELYIPRQLPVDLDVRRDEIGGIIVTRERDAEGVANGTVGAVAADEIGDADRLLSAVAGLKRCAHAVLVPARRQRVRYSRSTSVPRRARYPANKRSVWLCGQLQDEGKGRVQLVKGQVFDELVVGRIGRLGMGRCCPPERTRPQGQATPGFPACAPERQRHGCRG